MTMTRVEIEALLDRLGDCIAEDLEGQRIDFKEWDTGSNHQSVRQAVAAAVCMANGGGGTVVFGVQDGVVGRDCAVLGVPHHVSVNRLKLRVYDGTDPRLTPVFEEVAVREGTRRLILMHVHPGMPPYTDTAGRGTVRIGKGLQTAYGNRPAQADRPIRSQRLYRRHGRCPSVTVHLSRGDGIPSGRRAQRARTRRHDPPSGPGPARSDRGGA